jgi:large subunit ribosomal protein L37Ae
MAKTKKVKAAGRFGARYGRSVRTRIAEIETSQRKKQSCLFCNGVAKRVSKGLWQCKKCNKKFASHTYFLPKKIETKKIEKFNKV